MEQEQVKNGIRWMSSTINVDIETGLIISDKLRIREYIIIRKIKKYEINGKQGIVKRINECERNRQQKLW